MTCWRLIDSGAPDAFLNMAIDEAVAFSVRHALAPPTLRLYGWSTPSLSIGCHQKIGDIDLDFLKDKGIPLVRRPTGGRAILHSEELTYSFSSPLTEPFSAGLRQCYSLIAHAFIAAFKKIGITVQMDSTRTGQYSKTPLCFKSRSYGELSYRGQKLAGSAQRRWSDGFLQQGSIPFVIDNRLINRLFRLDEQMGEVLRIMEPAKDDELKNAIVEGFEEVFGIRFIPEGLSPSEEALAQKLLEQKYLKEEWNLHGSEPDKMP